MPDFPPPPFALSEDEKHSPLWTRLKAHLTEELDTARIRNDQPLPEAETATLRGRIRLFKEIISLGEKPAYATGEVSDDGVVNV